MISREVFEQTLLSFFAPVRAFLQDPTVSEIMINGPFEIFVERRGRIERTEARFADYDALVAALRNLAQFVGRHVDEHRPILEARLPDGSRVEAVLPPAAPDGPTVSIRRFSRDTITLEQLIKLGTLSPDAASVLRALVAARQNILVGGGTGSGKTSLLNVLASLCDEDERIIVIEDSREVQLQKPHAVHLEARPPDARGQGEVTIRDLFRASLRMRPDRIVVGEIRGGEAFELVQAMTSGHGGCLCTVHASHPIDVANRLETLALMSDVALPLAALRAQIGSALDVVVQIARQRDGSRTVTHITDVIGYDMEKGFQLADIFVRRALGRRSDGTVLSELKPTGVLPQCTEALNALGVELPASVLEAAERAARKG